MKLTITIMLILSISSIVSAQSTLHVDDTVKKHSFMRMNLRFKSNYYYMGRADSARTPYLIPSIGYYHKSGLSLATSLSYLTIQDQNRVDLYTLSAGYDYFGKKVAFGVSASEYFFNDESFAVQAEMNTYLSAYFGYDFNWFIAFADGSIGLSDNTDVFLGLEVSRTFYAVHDKLLITPSLYTNAGTQHYYNEYYTYRSTTTGSMKGKGGFGHGAGGGNGTSTPVVSGLTIQDSEKFQILDYELSLQVSYNIYPWRFTTASTFLFPINPATVITEETTYQEDLDTGFLWSLGIRYMITW